MKPPPKRVIHPIFAIVLMLVCVPVSAKIPPLIIVDGSGISPDTISSIERYLSSTHADRLLFQFPDYIVFREITQEQIAQYKLSLKEAKDLFYNGEFDSSLKAFAALHRQLDESLPSATFAQTLRSLDRDALLYAVMAAREIKSPDVLSSYLETITARYPSLPIDSGEFPPWLRAEFQNALKGKKIRRFPVKIPSIHGCHVEVDGIAVSGTQKHPEFSEGMHTFQLNCESGHRSFMSYLRVSPQLTEWTPVDIAGFGTRTTAHTVIVTPGNGLQPTREALVPLLQQLMSPLDTDKMILIQSDIPQSSVALLDAHTGVQSVIVLESAPDSGPFPTDRITTAIDTLLRQPDTMRHPIQPPPVTPVRWYRHPLPWILLTGGAGLLASGIILGQKYGSPSTQAPYAMIMQITGATIAASGVAFFFIPGWQSSENDQTIGIQTVVSF